MSPTEVAEVLDRLSGDFEYEMTEDEVAVWTSSISTFDKDQCLRAIESLLDRFSDIPPIANFRLECIKQGQRSMPPDRCGCLDGWEFPSEENYVVACRQCVSGQNKAALVESYRAARAAQRRRRQTPELLKERPAQNVAEWAAQAREWLANGVPEPELVGAPDEDQWF